MMKIVLLLTVAAMAWAKTVDDKPLDMALKRSNQKDVHGLSAEESTFLALNPDMT